MGKTLAGILEIGIGIALEFTPFNAIGTSLIVTGLATTASALLTTTPKPPQTEMSLKAAREPREALTDALFAQEEEEGGEWIISSPALCRGDMSRSNNPQRHDDLFDADDLAASFA